MVESFADRLCAACLSKKSVICVGLDPRPDRLPAVVSVGDKSPADASADFCTAIISAVADLVPIVKPNIAFFEALGQDGIAAYARVCAHARQQGVLVIGDVKRGDIGSTAEAYAAGLLGKPEGPGSLANHDALTVNAYLGSDGVKPFLTRASEYGQGLFALVKTSNPSSAELQDLELVEGGTVAERMAKLVSDWGEAHVGTSGYSSLGAVVGATHGEMLARFRSLMPHTPFLLPGYGAQGAGAADVVGAFDSDGLGALVSASRSVIFASSEADFADAARQAAVEMNTEINAALAAR